MIRNFFSAAVIALALVSFERYAGAAADGSLTQPDISAKALRDTNLTFSAEVTVTLP